MKDSNKLIAEFMGYKVVEENDYPKDTNLDVVMIDAEMKYHTPREWLMRVVEKIENNASEVVMTNAECTISSYHNETDAEFYEESWGKNRFSATYQAVVEFIKWHNLVEGGNDELIKEYYRTHQQTI